MFQRILGVLVLGLSASVVWPSDPPADVPAPAQPGQQTPVVEVVFCLDTTGSMTGLIEGAKQKIWLICNQIAGGKPTPLVKVGLVAYRDRGDQYVTKVFELTDDLDEIHGHLREFQASGGGDTPESVNQALHDAVHKIAWSKSDQVLKIIFLVGDAPPHMDYPDDVKYPETCKAAAEKGIIINAIQCGNLAETREIWQDISRKAEGAYVQIAQDGGVVAIDTPFDKRLAEINVELAKTTLAWGDAPQQALSERKKEGAEALAPSSSRRPGRLFAKGGRAAAFDLLDAVKEGRVKLEELPKEQLPPELRELTPEQRKEFLDKLDQRRTELRKEALELDKQRSDFIAKKIAEDKGKAKGGFDQQVLDILRNQAKKYKIDY